MRIGARSSGETVVSKERHVRGGAQVCNGMAVIGQEPVDEEPTC